MADPNMADLRRLVAAAVDEARQSHAPNVEAEHLLLALSSRPSSPAGRVLAEHGLGYDEIQRALLEEQHSSLRAAGVEPVPRARLISTPRRRRPGWGASAKDCLRRASRAGAKLKRRRMAELDLLLGVLTAELGTVPRALSITGVDRTQLARSVEQSR